jgi:nicotinamidase-related amidase
MSNNTALLIIDVQMALFLRGKYDGKKIFQAEQLLQNIRTLIQKACSSNTPIFYVQHTDNRYLRQGSSFWEIHPQIKPEANDTVILKYHVDSFNNTNLHEQLKSLDIQRLVICGLQTELCVDTACRAAFSLGYKQNIFVSDGHSTFDSNILSAAQIIEHHNGIIGGQAPNNELRFADLKKTEEVEF